MKINSTQFVKSSPLPQDCPAADRPEYAFVGRSNVGKSSLINMLTGRRNLASTSATPGKTQLINHFIINENKQAGEKGWYLADLPGLGYAKVSKKSRARFRGIVYNYLENRGNLLTVFMLIDSRIPSQKIDLDFMEWMGIREIPFTIVLTKTDKLSGNEVSGKRKELEKAMSDAWEEMPPLIASAAKNRQGNEEILHLIDNTNGIFSV